MNLRPETDQDRSAIATLIARTYLENGAKLIEMTGLLRDLPQYRHDLGVLAETEAGPVAYALFTPLEIGGSEGAVLLAPLAMDTDQPELDYNTFMHQAIERVKDMGFKAVLMHGAADMYADDGFVPATKHGIVSSISYPGATLLIKPLVEGIDMTGDIAYPPFLSKF